MPTWEAPMTFISGAILTAGQMNTFVRDNTSVLRAQNADQDTAIAANAANILNSGGGGMPNESALTQAIQANTTAIESANDLIDTNTENIGTNTTSIGTLTTNTGTNAMNIATQTGRIDTNINSLATINDTLGTYNTRLNSLESVSVVALTNYLSDYDDWNVDHFFPIVTALVSAYNTRHALTGDTTPAALSNVIVNSRPFLP